MHKLLISAIGLSLLSTAAHAQIGAGTIYLGGSVGYSHETTESTFPGAGSSQYETGKMSSFTIRPTVGYFVAENLLLGLSLGYGRNKATSPIYSLPTSGTGTPRKVDERENTQQSFAIGPVARYYKFVGEHAAFFGHLAGGYQSLKYSYSDPTTIPNDAEQKGHGFFGQLSPGFAYFPSNKIGLEVSLQGLTYSRNTLETPGRGSMPDVESSQSRFEVGLGLASLNLGAAFYLGRD
ncbi:outer membrane beta-barrel protein [Hymenobacter metallicola]|uniref:Outer membrane protein beta-barrel domain-containing protein n=1 Tax=Hymenobacter metallicola TaxID=2563114 RepID=A0A4Z0Q982_9BACT|nr:outer membrane beta-barrel protein [Hymenobacter metallicola]TGE26570.1 hypothetical protein E5K02_17430 [Hymenobacter metallicola]